MQCVASMVVVEERRRGDHLWWVHRERQQGKGWAQEKAQTGDLVLRV